jgi:hypothetical protein
VKNILWEMMTNLVKFEPQIAMSLQAEDFKEQVMGVSIQVELMYRVRRFGNAQQLHLLHNS